MIAISPKGNKIRVFENKFLCWGYLGYFYGIFIAVRDIEDGNIIAHELTHLDQMKRDGFLKFIRMFFDMDYLVKNECEAYKADGRFDDWIIADIVSKQYSVCFLGKLLGFRTKRYRLSEVIEVMS